MAGPDPCDGAAGAEIEPGGVPGMPPLARPVAEVRGERRRTLAVAVALAVVTFAVYVPSLGNGFVNWDDVDYVADNPFLAGGLSWASVRWSFTAFHAGNWHPLTWLSHALDLSLYGRDGVWGHHLSSILLHAAAAGVLLIALKRLTKRLWLSAFVAALFALHPLHVESVSWVSERKDVLCALFTFLALWAHAWYAESPSLRRYLPVLGATAAALVSKPMAVTLPLVLLVLDWWPLRRLSWRTVVEKVPLFVMAAMVAVLTWLAQARSETIASLQIVPLQSRFAHAAVAYVMYLAEAFWPAPGMLVPFHPLPGGGGPSISGLMAQLAILLVAAITYAAWRFRAKRPYLLAGWLLYAGMLLPVSGLVQVGHQVMADRYTYISLVWMFLAVACLASDLVAPRRWLRRGAIGVAFCVLGGLGWVTWQQEGVWRNTKTLWERVLQSYPRSSKAWNYLGHVYAGLDVDKGLRAEADLGKAEECYRTAERLFPGNWEIQCSLGMLMGKKGQYEEADNHLRRAIELYPGYADGQYNYGFFLMSRGRTAEAVDRFRLTLEIEPGHADARRALDAIQSGPPQPAYP